MINAFQNVLLNDLAEIQASLPLFKALVLTWRSVTPPALIDCLFATVRRTQRIKSQHRWVTECESDSQHFVHRDACESTLSRFWIPVETDFYAKLFYTLIRISLVPSTLPS